MRCARAAKCAAAEIILAITILEQVHFEMQVKYNFPLKLFILDREYKHVLTWQKTGVFTFDIKKPEPPTDVPDPTLLSRSGASLAQGPDGASLAQGPDRNPGQKSRGNAWLAPSLAGGLQEVALSLNLVSSPGAEVGSWGAGCPSCYK